ncbi:MAG: hypothetical protein Q9169_005288 [Polycauliona sp. 2 TL-2023]
MSYMSSYTEARGLAAQVRAKFHGEYNTRKEQNLRLIIAHAQLYDRLDDHIESLRAIRECNASGKNPYAPVAAVSDHQDSLRTNQQANPQGKRPTPHRETPFTPPTPATESAIEDDEDPKPLSQSSESTCSVTVKEIEDINHEDTDPGTYTPPFLDRTPFTMMTQKSPCSADPTSQPVISETFIEDPSESESDSDSDLDFESDGDSGSSDSSIYTGDLEPDLSSSTTKAVPVPISKPDTPDVLPQASPDIDDSLPTLQRCGPSTAASPEEKETSTESENQPRNRAVIASKKSPPLVPQLCGDSSGVSAKVHWDHELLQQCHQRLVDAQNDGEEDTWAIASVIARNIPSLAFWNLGRGEMARSR